MRLLKALRREPVDCTPVWFMRQAGRYMAEYRELRKKHTILEICKTAELAAQVTFQPIRRFPGLDAAIIFSDILVLTEPMGIQVEFVKGEGPAIHNPVATEADVAALKPVEPERDLRPVLDAIRIVKRDLKVPLIGFAGGPFTLASYIVEGGPSKDYAKTRALMKTATWPKLMTRLSDAVSAHLNAQLKAGADLVQLFDSWVGNLSVDEYREHVMPYSKRIFSALKGPSIHFGTQTAHLLESIRDAGGTCIGVDFRIPIDEAWKRLGDGVAVQGNLDPSLMVGPPEPLLAATDEVLSRVGGRPGHLFNLGHGILPETPLENVEAVIERVHARTRR
ncbi:MAG TPA: uroporphyrinogen decarboxylase [Planctomycetota bacterium]|nr:uroporphyrinogen decarboxylase [Planctomycetota bacterium]